MSLAQHVDQTNFLLPDSSHSNHGEALSKKVPASVLLETAKKINQSTRQKYGTYLYLKATTFYFRYAFNPKQKEKFGKSEIRISLKTGFAHIAKRKARELIVRLEDILLDESTSTHQKLKERLTHKLEEVLDKFPVKREPSIAAIKERMQHVLQSSINAADDELYRPQGAVVYDKSVDFIPTDPKYWLEFGNELTSMALGSKEKLMEQDYPQVIVSLLRDKVFHPDEITITSIPKILNEYRKIQVCFNEIMLAREKNDFAYEKQFKAEPAVVYNTNVSVPTPTPTSHDHTQHTSDTKNDVPLSQQSMLLSEFIEKYITTKIADKQWKEHGVADHRNRLCALLEVLGDIPVQSIAREDFRRFRDIFAKLPPNYKKMSKYKDKSIEEIIAIPHEKTYSVKTINITVEAIASMFEWGVREGYLEKNNAKSLQIKDDRQDITLKDAFTPDDIQKIFFTGDYIPDAFEQPAYYWAPLVGLYTGMRLEEICQLACADIKKDQDIWCFDINTQSPQGSNEVKNLKNKNAHRQIPIHQELLSLGFIEYVEQVQAAGHERIFPELKKTQSSPKYGKNVGKAFSRHIKKVGIVKGNKSFHSLRHSFSQYFKERNLHTDVFRQIFGHGINELASRQYGSKFSVKQCYDEVISKLDLDVYKRS